MTARTHPRVSPAHAPLRGGKAAVRAHLRTARANLGRVERAKASARIRRRLADLPELAGRRAVLAYAAVGAEVNLDPFLRELLEAGIALYLPWVEDERIGLARIRDLDHDLAPGWAGVREPRAGQREITRPSLVEAAIVPGIGFDRRGYRIGHGGGHFDRLLGQLRPGTTTIGVGFDVQLVDFLPVEAHDQRLDVVVTESGAGRPPRG